MDYESASSAKKQIDVHCLTQDVEYSSIYGNWGKRLFTDIIEIEEIAFYTLNCSFKNSKVIRFGIICKLSDGKTN